MKLPRYSMSVPPTGVALVIMAGLYLLLGLVGHDPWKSDDVSGIGIAWSMIQGSGWLVPRIAGEPFLAHPPLYFWIAAVTGKGLSWAIAPHDAIRLASGLFGALFFAGMGVTAGSLYGSQTRSAAVLSALGCIGLLVHIHDANPAIALLAFLPWAVHGLNLARERPGKGGAIAGWAIGLAFLAAGWVAPMILVPLALTLPLISTHWRNRAAYTGIALALILGAAIATAWPALLFWLRPAMAAVWWQQSVQAIDFGAPQWPRIAGFMELLPWYAWPALPLALWALWLERRSLRQPGVVLPLTLLATTLFALSATADPRSGTALPLLPPFVLLAARAAGSLQRGAANAFDWFGMMTFSFFAGVVWLGWIAMLSGEPAPLARVFAKMEPGFALHFSAFAFVIACSLTLAWTWLVFSTPRSPQRGTLHWAAGVILTWGLVTTLWLPWIDYGKSYRRLSDSLAAALPAERGRICARNMGDAQRASFHYFDDIVTVRQVRRDASQCKLLLVSSSGSDTQEFSAGAAWHKIWEGRRPGDRNELFRLYRRDRS